MEDNTCKLTKWILNWSSSEIPCAMVDNGEKTIALLILIKQRGHNLSCKRINKMNLEGPNVTILPDYLHQNEWHKSMNRNCWKWRANISIRQRNLSPKLIIKKMIFNEVFIIFLWMNKPIYVWIKFRSTFKFTLNFEGISFDIWCKNIIIRRSNLPLLSRPKKLKLVILVSSLLKLITAWSYWGAFIFNQLSH